MTDMDVGRDDRYRGNGYRGGNNKRRRDGKLGEAPDIPSATNTTLQMRMTITTRPGAAMTAEVLSVDVSTMGGNRVADMRSPRMRNCVEQY